MRRPLRPHAARPLAIVALGRLASLVLFALLVSGVLARPASAAADATYAALRAAKPDGRRVPVSGLVLQRDAFRFQLDSGALHLLAPVDGRTVGAVFVGKGSYRLEPASEAERHHLAIAADADDKKFEVLSDSFDEMVLLWGDGTGAEIERHAAAEKGSPDAQAQAVWERHMKRPRKDLRTNFHLRLLADLLNGPAAAGEGVFLASFDGKQRSEE